MFHSKFHKPNQYIRSVTINNQKLIFSIKLRFSIMPKTFLPSFYTEFVIC